METLKKWMADFIGYLVSFICMLMPRTCEEWTSLFAMMIAFFTLFFITIPKAWPNVKRFWRKLGVLP